MRWIRLKLRSDPESLAPHACAQRIAPEILPTQIIRRLKRGALENLLAHTISSSDVKIYQIIRQMHHFSPACNRGG